MRLPPSSHVVRPLTGADISASLQNNPLHFSGRSAPCRTAIEPLEPRWLLSTIVWGNRNDPSNNFLDTFGANVGLAMGVVDAAIDHWERVIDDFNYRSATQLTLNISMRDGANDFGGQAPPSQIGLDASGAPQSATIFLGRGNDTDSDGQGDGAGYYLDPEPDDFAEFPNITNAFLGGSDPGTAPSGLIDFYSLVAHEIGHTVGMTSASGSDWREEIDLWATDTNINDTGGAGNLWAYKSTTVGRAVLTDSDLAGSGVIPPHTARGVQSFMFNGEQYDAAFDLMNNSGGVGNRRLISNLIVGMLDDVYSYDTIWPEWFGSMYTMLDLGSGTLTLRGGTGNSDDTVRVFRSGSGYEVSVNVGNDVPGTGPTDAFVSFFDADDVNNIIINTGDGDDLIQIRSLFAGTPVAVDAGTGSDRVELAIGDFDSNLLSDLTIQAGAGDDELWINDLTDGPGADEWVIQALSITKPSRSLIYTGFEQLEILGSDNNDVFDLRSSGVLTDLIIHGNEGTDRFEVAQPTEVLDDFAGNATLLGGSGGDILNLYDNADTGPDNYLFDAPGSDNFNFTKTGGGAFFGLLYSSMSTLRLEANNAANDIRVEQLFPAATLVGGAGDDFFDIGDGNLQFLLNADLRLEGGLGDDSLLLDDSADTGADQHIFDGDFLTDRYTKNVMPETVEFVSIADVTLETGSGQSVDIVARETSLSVANLFVNGNGFGPDRFFVGDGELFLVRSDVHFDGFSDGAIYFNNSAGAGNFYDLNFGTFSTASFTHTFANVTAVDINLGPGDDRLEVYNSFGYDLNASMGAGDDTVNVGRGDMIGAGDATLFGGEGSDEFYFDNTSGAAPLTLVADQGAGLPFVDVFNGNVRTLYDSFALLQVEAGPMNDTLTTIIVPSLTRARLYAMGGDDDINVDGHPTLNSALFPPVQIDVGSGLDNVAINADGAGGARGLMTSPQSMASLAVHPAGRLTLEETATPGENVITTQSLLATGRIDLTNGGLIYDYDVPTNQEVFIANLIATGFNGGAWNGNGLATSLGNANSFGLGYAQASLVAPGGMFLNQPVDGTAIAVRFTRYGDTNLDGAVDFADFLRLRSGFGMRGLWSSGDFDYDLDVDFADFLRMRSNFGLSI